MQFYVIFSVSSLSADEIKQVERDSNISSFWTDKAKNYLLLLRGLLAGGILAFYLRSKRWQVNYGLDPQRIPPTNLTLPFRAKDNPTPQSEFSHPDVVITLTSIYYYYSGLTDKQLFLCFSHLLRSNQAAVAYSEWSRDSPNLPPTFRHIAGINIKDHFQYTQEVFPALCYYKSAINYFLTFIIFPKEMKEFPLKLSASRWDIRKIKKHPTTGFSGTIDSQHLLPLTVNHLDLPDQKYTNAMVLQYLLGPENSVALIPGPRQRVGSPSIDISSAIVLLDMVLAIEPPVCVILDVGAQIIKLDNLQVAQTWLAIKKEASKAIIFFNDKDELSVLDQEGRVESLQISPFAKQLDLCLVYLNEAHTRGTDLRLPKTYRAAVTCGANLTKDRLVQACMRMRKLGKGQSVVFCVPQDIKTKILKRSNPDEDAPAITVADILSWVISETCMDVQRSMPLWAAQGERFGWQAQLWNNAWDGTKFVFEQEKAEEFMEDEAQTIAYRYSPISEIDSMEQTYSDEQVMERCREFGIVADWRTSTLYEEQERELSTEIEQERQVERPVPMQAREHHLHPDLTQYVITGVFDPLSDAFMPAFESLESLTAATHMNIFEFPQGLYVTKDFATTVQKPSTEGFTSDSFERHVQYLISSPDEGSSKISNLLIISPFEAQRILPIVVSSNRVTLHVYALRLNVSLKSLDTLDLYTQGTPFRTTNLDGRLPILLNLFSGQLYFSSFMQYTQTCELLSLACQAIKLEGVPVRADGFIEDGGTFTDSPVKFLKVLLSSIRRNGEGIDNTHMGKVLHGVIMEDIEFA